MRFHPLAVSVVVGAIGSSSMADAFVLPKSASTGSRATAASVRMAAKNNGGSPYGSLEENLFDPNRNNGDGSSIDFDSSESPTSNNVENPSTPPKKPKKPNPRTEKIRAKLQEDLNAAEESRARTAQQLADAESSRLALQAEAEKAAQEAEALEAKFNAFEAKEAARAAAGGGLGAFGEIAGPLVGGIAAFGGIAVARDQLAARSEKAEEERLRREEEERQAQEAAKRKEAQQAQSKNLLPIVGAGVAGLGAFGAFFNSEGGAGSVVDAMSKIAQEKVGPQKNAGSVTTSVPDPSTVDLPYLDKKIAKAESKQKPVNPWAAKQLEKKAAEEQKAVEARLEEKLAQAPALAEKAVQAEAKAAEEARVAAEKKVAEEKQALAAKQAAEQKAAEEAAAAAQRAKAEKAAAEKKAAEEAAAAAQRAKAEKAAAEKKAAEEAAAAAEKAKAEKIAADKLAFEKMKEEQAAKAAKLAAEEKAKQEKIAADKVAFEKMRAEQEERKAREEEAAAALELLKQQDSQWQGIFPKVPAVSEMLFGDNRPSDITDKGLSNIFNPNIAIVGGVALAGAAVAAAVAAANESPSVSSTFKVTGKTPKEYLESEDTSSAPKKTIRIPKPAKEENQAPPDTAKTSPSPGSKEALREELKRQRDNLSKQVVAKETLEEPTVEDTQPPLSQETDTSVLGASSVENTGAAGPAFTPPAKKSYSPFGGGKPKAIANDPLYSPRASQSVDQSIPQSPEPLASEQSTNEDVSFVPMPKKSYSPFGGGKPKAVANDSLYSPPASQSGMVDVSEVEIPVKPVASTPNQDVSGVTPPATMPKKSYSPFGGGKPKAVTNDSLYSPPTSASTMVDFGEIETSVQPVAPVPDQDVSDVTFSTPMPKKSYSPFGGGKPKAPVGDSLYSPPTSYNTPEPTISTNDQGGEDWSESMLETSPEAVASGPMDYSSSAPYEPASTSPEISSFTQNTSPPAKTNYSPFGRGKPFATTDDSLYRPPSSEGVSDSAVYDVPESEPTIASPENSVLPPQNYSPFGGAKPVSPSNDPLYAPPSDERYESTSNVEDSLPFAASGLDDTPGASGPETTAFRASTPKKSFSPFGTKPQAPSGNGGGYLNDL